MKFSKANIIVLILILFSGCTTNNDNINHTDELTFFNNPRVQIAQNFELLPVSEIKPNGWINSIMNQDITERPGSQLGILTLKLIGDGLYNTAHIKNENALSNVENKTITGADREISLQCGMVKPRKFVGWIFKKCLYDK